MWIDTACEALRQRRLLELQYGGARQCVEVHAVGFSKMGHAVMRAWQVSGENKKGARAGWRLMRMDEVPGASLTAEASMAPRAGYKRGDPAIARIIAEL